MRAALAAEWLRLRRRRDLMILLVALPLLVIVGLVSSYQSIASGFGFAPGPPPPEVVAEIARRQAGYAFPASVTTAFGFGPILALIGILLGAFLLGSEFGWGTLRGALLADGRRVRLLAAKWVGLLGLMAILVLEVALAGPIASAVLTLSGARLPASDVSLPASLASLGVWLLGGAALAALGATAALLIRSAAGGILLAFLYAFVELLAGGAAIFQQPGWEVFRGVSLSGSLTWLATAAQEAGRPTSIASPFVEPRSSPPVPPEVSAVALVAWLVGLSLVAAWRMRRLDVVE